MSLRNPFDQAAIDLGADTPYIDGLKHERDTLQRELKELRAIKPGGRTRGAGQRIHVVKHRLTRIEELLCK